MWHWEIHLLHMEHFFVKGQEGAYTNLLSQQFALAGGGDFKLLTL
jgi:hypothetical protein